MSPGEGLSEQLRRLRIERPDKSPPPSPSRLGLVLLVTGLVLGAGALAAYRFVLGGARTVEVVYARAEPAGKAISAAVLSATGYAITGEKYISIGVRVPGRIERFLVDESDRVEVGQPLVKLDGREYRAQMGRAEAALRLARAHRDLAKAQLKRTRALSADGITSEDELDQAVNRFEVTEATVSQAENEVAQARVNLDDTMLRSPVRGVVLAKLKAVGEIAVPGGFAGSGDLLRIADLSELRAEVDINEADLSHVHLAQDAEVTPDAYPQKRYRAKVVKLNPQVNRQKGTLKVEVRIEEPDADLLPDMSVRVTFLAAAANPQDDGGGAPTVLAPRSAVRRGSEGVYVWVVRAGRLRRQPLEVGAELGQEVAVTNGLVGGEALVVGPEEELREGAHAATRGR